MTTPATAASPATYPAEWKAAANERLDWARQITIEAGEITQTYFRSPTLRIEWKEDNTPVTLGDKASEQHLRKRIEERFPEDGILGEEYPEKPGTSGYKWILDPIDGTKPFMHGVPLYTNLVAVLEETSGEPILGIINAPASGETIHAAIGGGAWYQNGGGEIRRAHVSELKDLQQTARISRTWGDGYGYMMVAIGRAEVMIDAKMSLWDAACLKPILEEAGGTFTSWSGEPTVHAGEGIASNGHVLKQVLAITAGK
jgi:histidinol-phosphatase